MPRSSDRKRLLKALEREVIRRNEAAYIHERDAALAAELRNEFGVGLPSGVESTGSYEEMVDMAVYAAFESVSNERYGLPCHMPGFGSPKRLHLQRCMTGCCIW